LIESDSWTKPLSQHAPKSNKKEYPPAPGAAPELQGRYAFLWHHERKPPAWHRGHENPDFIKRWLAGYDDEAQQAAKRGEVE